MFYPNFVVVLLLSSFDKGPGRPPRSPPKKKGPGRPRKEDSSSPPPKKKPRKTKEPEAKIVMKCVNCGIAKFVSFSCLIQFWTHDMLTFVCSSYTLLYHTVNKSSLTSTTTYARYATQLENCCAVLLVTSSFTSSAPDRGWSRNRPTIGSALTAGRRG